MFEIVAELHTSPLRSLYFFSACCVCVCVCARARVCKPLFILSVGRGLKALAYSVPRGIVEFKKKEADPVSCAVYGVNRRRLVCWERGFDSR